MVTNREWGAWSAQWSGPWLRRFVVLMHLLCLAAGLYLANGLLVNELPGLQNPDEIIPLRSIQHMAQTHTLDTDWAHADLWEGFQRVHFNFSGYMLSAYAYVSAMDRSAITMDGPLLGLLRQFSAVTTLALLALTFLLLRPRWGAVYAALAAFAVLLAPLTFQDAHYARPESLGTLLFTACFLIAMLKPGRLPRDASRAVLICVISGFLVSIKVTYALSALFVIPVVAAHMTGGQRASWGSMLYAGAACALAFLCGALLGAPYAFSHPGTYVEGLHALQTQYAGFHPPHSLLQYSLGQQARWIFAYFLSTMGATALVLHVVGLACRSTRAAKLTFLGIALLTVVFFALQHVFFERNLSHLLPGFMIIAVGGIRYLATTAASKGGSTSWSGRASTVVITALLFMLLVKTSYGMTLELRHAFSMDNVQAERTAIEKHAQRIASRIGATRVVEVSYAQVIAGSLPLATECTLYKIPTFGDDWSRQFMNSVAGSAKIDHVQWSRFAHVPTSTLQTYHSPTIYLMHNPDLCRDDPA